MQVDDTLKTQMNNFLLSTASQQEIQSLDNKIHETVETINGLKTSREFFLSFAKVALKIIIAVALCFILLLLSYSGSPIVHQQMADVPDSGPEDYDRCGWKPRGGEEV